MSLPYPNEEEEPCEWCDGTGKHEHPDLECVYDCRHCRGSGIAVEPEPAYLTPLPDERANQARFAELNRRERERYEAAMKPVPILDWREERAWREEQREVADRVERERWER